MDDELTLYLSQRAELVASDDAGVGQLRQHDRKLLSAMDRGVLGSPLTQPEGAYEALVEALEADPEQNALLLEARDRIWPGELARIQKLLLEREGERQAAWWLAAHYSALACPEAFPCEWAAQVWAVQALDRRGQRGRSLGSVVAALAGGLGSGSGVGAGEWAGIAGVG